GDGRILYTRWEYSDRGQIFPQPLYQMNPDGTGQTELYGNNSWFPTTILHARAIPGSPRIVAILTGHHSSQVGKLALIDPGKGNQENEGVVEIAPVRPTPAVRVDAYGQDGDLFQYPYPLNESAFLVAYDPLGWGHDPLRFAIYFVLADGRRELLAVDPAVSCNQPVPLAARPRPHVRPSAVDYRRDSGVYYIEDVYFGPGLAGVPRGTIDRIRVIALRLRAAGIRSNMNRGPAGDALVSTPVSIGNGSWDVKVVLGDAKVHEDGSACFEVPARTPVYFQALDAKGRAVQTMRSWSTLQPGETFSCLGCHERKTSLAPLRGRVTMASRVGPQALEPFGGPPRGFSFAAEVQPVLDRHCIRCHDGGESFSLLGRATVEEASGRRWSDAYLALTKAERRGGFLYGRPNRMVNFISAQSEPTMLPPYRAGSTQSGLIPLLESGHGDAKPTPEEIATIACWIDLLVPYCGDYTEANAWTAEETETYARFLAKRKAMEAIERENISALLRRSVHPDEP
ncbi:MAG: hypothetical protein JXP34_03225, partial [Planctomycetes bacterium]|nr:hypothetical protein [Planctomycetota bacterium]